MIVKKQIIKSIAVFLIAMLLFSCHTDIKKIKELDVDNLPSQNAKNITIVRTDSAKIITKIFAPEVENFYNVQNPYTLFPKGLEATTYKHYPKIESSLKCNKAKNLKNEGLWIGENKVEVVNDLGYKLTTELLYWDLEKQEIYTDKNVRIETDKEIIWGKGLRADQNFKNYEILEPIGTIYIDE